MPIEAREHALMRKGRYTRASAGLEFLLQALQAYTWVMDWWFGQGSFLNIAWQAWRFRMTRYVDRMIE